MPPESLVACHQGAGIDRLSLGWGQNMHAHWYVARGNKKCGPFSVEQLRQFAAAGKIRLTDGIWREGMERSVAAANVKNLFPPAEAPSQASAPAAVETAPATESAADSVADSLPDPADMALMPAESPPESLREETEPAPDDDADTSGETDQPAQRRLAAKDRPAPRPPDPVKKRRAVALRGAIILAQDGVSVQYRKKCQECGFEDTSRSSMLIGQGVTRSHFFCRKCRKNREVEIRGSLQ
jgi:hypothetical protein